MKTRGIGCIELFGGPVDNYPLFTRKTERRNLRWVVEDATFDGFVSFSGPFILKPSNDRHHS